MTPGLNQEWVDYVIEVADQQSLNSIWFYSQLDDSTFEVRCEAFYWILEKVLDSGRLRLIKNGEYLTGTPQEQVQRFRDVFPKSDFPFPEDPELDASYWFYGIGKPEVPAEAVWRGVYPDGRVEWFHCP
jgi:hypothetical protein